MATQILEISQEEMALYMISFARKKVRAGVLTRRAKGKINVLKLA